MINLYIYSEDYNKERLQKIIDNTISQIDNGDVSNLDAIYIIAKKKTVEVFPGINMPFDPYYLHKGKNGKPCIVISNESIFRKQRGHIQRIIINVARPIIYVLSVVPLLIWCIKDKNIKFWYLYRENKINNKVYSKAISRSEILLVNSILYHIGIHKIYETYCKVVYILISISLNLQ
jgi:hypothetical protein